MRTHKNKFGKNLKKILESMNMSQAEFANKSGLTEACISTIISGKRDPQLSTIVKILKTASIEFEELLYGVNL